MANESKKIMKVVGWPYNIRQQQLGIATGWDKSVRASTNAPATPIGIPWKKRHQEFFKAK